MNRKALIVEDNCDIAALVCLHLGDINCVADIAGSGAEGLEMYARGSYDLVILDLMLPVLDGLSVCRRLRSQPGYVPILMLTAKSTELDRVLGLEVGADDYLTKPFSIPELLARIKALFRRVDALGGAPAQTQLPELLVHGELSVNVAKRQVCVRDRELALTAKEFDLLLHFLRHPGQVYSRAQLLDEVWGYHYEGYAHTVNSHINRLRAKVEVDPARPRHILTVWGVGYKLAE
jgi:two-component system OmpR family response regulator